MMSWVCGEPLFRNQELLCLQNLFTIIELAQAVPSPGLKKNGIDIILIIEVQSIILQYVMLTDYP